MYKDVHPQTNLGYEFTNRLKQMLLQLSNISRSTKCI